MTVTFLTDIVFVMIGLVIGNSGKIAKGIYNNFSMRRKLDKLQHTN